MSLSERRSLKSVRLMAVLSFLRSASVSAIFLNVISPSPITAISISPPLMYFSCSVEKRKPPPATIEDGLIFFIMRKHELTSVWWHV
ncbi:MAG: hypothetical protein ACD_47C00726G0002 [uncultured bacterium]|nr:MAG: hypothetical protein ACD_47C00726G0002 [uncultured bacterium]